jgi:hypothetical protein
VNEEYWGMQWSGEVLPEPAMIPDLSVFLRAVSANSQVVTRGGFSHALSPHVSNVREASLTRAREQFPALLKLPSLPVPAGEQKTRAIDQPGVPLRTR